MAFEILQAVRIDTIGAGGTADFDQYQKLRGLVVGHTKRPFKGRQEPASVIVWSNGAENIVIDKMLIPATLCT